MRITANGNGVPAPDHTAGELPVLIIGSGTRVAPIQLLTFSPGLHDLQVPQAWRLPKVFIR